MWPFVGPLDASQPMILLLYSNKNLTNPSMTLSDGIMNTLLCTPRHNETWNLSFYMKSLSEIVLRSLLLFSTTLHPPSNLSLRMKVSRCPFHNSSSSLFCILCEMRENSWKISFWKLKKDVRLCVVGGWEKEKKAIRTKRVSNLYKKPTDLLIFLTVCVFNLISFAHTYPRSRPKKSFRSGLTCFQSFFSASKGIVCEF